MTDRPYTPETLADRWGCSAETVRQLVHLRRAAAVVDFARVRTVPGA
jgi:hypothetical protein